MGLVCLRAVASWHAAVVLPRCAPMLQMHVSGLACHELRQLSSSAVPAAPSCRHWRRAPRRRGQHGHFSRPHRAGAHAGEQTALLASDSLLH